MTPFCFWLQFVACCFTCIMPLVLLFLNELKTIEKKNNNNQQKFQLVLFNEYFLQYYTQSITYINLFEKYTEHRLLINIQMLCDRYRAHREGESAMQTNNSFETNNCNDN